MVVVILGVGVDIARVNATVGVGVVETVVVVVVVAGFIVDEVVAGGVGVLYWRGADVRLAVKVAAFVVALVLGRCGRGAVGVAAR